MSRNGLPNGAGYYWRKQQERKTQQQRAALDRVNQQLQAARQLRPTKGGRSDWAIPAAAESTGSPASQVPAAGPPQGKARKDESTERAPRHQPLTICSPLDWLLKLLATPPLLGGCVLAPLFALIFGAASIDKGKPQLLFITAMMVALALLFIKAVAHVWDGDALQGVVGLLWTAVLIVLLQLCVGSLVWLIAVGGASLGAFGGIDGPRGGIVLLAVALAAVFVSTAAGIRRWCRHPFRLTAAARPAAHGTARNVQVSYDQASKMEVIRFVVHRYDNRGNGLQPVKVEFRSKSLVNTVGEEEEVLVRGRWRNGLLNARAVFLPRSQSWVQSPPKRVLQLAGEALLYCGLVGAFAAVSIAVLPTISH